MLFSRKNGQAFYRTYQRITYPAGLDPPQKMCYQPSVFLILRKCPASQLMSYLHNYGDSSIQTLIGQFGRDLPAKLLEGTKFEKATIVASDLSTEWKKYRQQPKDDISMQLKELLINDMLIALFPNLHKLATICLSILISTASAERSFSDMKLIKNRLRNRLTELSLSNLMKFVFLSPQKLTDSDLVSKGGRGGGEGGAKKVAPRPYFTYTFIAHIHYHSQPNCPLCCRASGCAAMHNKLGSSEKRCTLIY